MATTPAHHRAPHRRPTASDCTVLDYQGGKTTLCAGCGHNAISERIIDAFYEMGSPAGAGDEVVGHRLLVEDARRIS